MTTAIDDKPVAYGSREDRDKAAEQLRRDEVKECRAYYDGTQYDADNAACEKEWRQHALAGEKSIARHLFEKQEMPEYLRRHAYSTHVQESVDWIADRLAAGFKVEVTPAAAEQVITDCLNATPELAAGDEDEDRDVATVLREAAKCGDVPVLIRWDASEGCCWLEFWDSEQVQVEFEDRRKTRIKSVIVEQVDWVMLDGQERQVTLRRVWSVDSRAVPARCVERVYIAEDQRYQEGTAAWKTHEWTVPFVPWWIIRSKRKNLRDGRGTPLIKTQARRAADRFNSVEQVSYLISRYNSHGNVVVIGDTAMVQNAAGQGVVRKDVADVLTFPGGTAVSALTLPTDPQMIEHQHDVLAEQLYNTFGLTRTDQQTVTNLGPLSGYALEILNEKAAATFDKVSAQLRKDIKQLLNLVLDCHDVWDKAGAEPDDDTGGSGEADTDPTVNRDSGDNEPGSLVTEGGDTASRRITVRLGTGGVVDRAAARDDALAGLISRRHYHRLVGTPDDDILKIENELAEEADEQEQRENAAAEASLQVGTPTGQVGGIVNNADTGQTPLFDATVAGSFQ